MPKTAKQTLVFTMAFVLYFATRGIGLDEWDAVQFAMATQRFDLWHHQPHPPGYPLFVFPGWLLQHLFHCSPEFALHLVSCVGGALFVAGWFSIVLLEFDELKAWVLAVALAVTPIVWMSSTRAMTDSLGAGLLSFELLFVLRYARSKRQGDLNIAAVIGAAAVGVRPGLILTVMVILATGLWRQSWKIGAQALGLFVAACLLWVVPTSWSQWRIRPEVEWWWVYPYLLFDQWAWRFNQPHTYIGAGDWSLAYLKDRFDYHIVGWFKIGFGFLPQQSKPLIGGALSVFGLASYFFHFTDKDREFWKVNAAWSSVHVVTIFCFVPWEQRYYLPIFPLLLIAILFGYLRLPKAWKLTALAFPASLVFISFPLAIQSHTEEAPAIRLVRFLQNRYPSSDRPKVLLLVGESLRIIQWYGPEFPVFHVGAVKDVDRQQLDSAIAMYTDNAGLELPPGWQLKPIARFARSELITPKQSQVDLYEIKRPAPTTDKT